MAVEPSSDGTKPDGPTRHARADDASGTNRLDGSKAQRNVHKTGRLMTAESHPPEGELKIRTLMKAVQQKRTICGFTSTSYAIPKTSIGFN